MFHVEMRMGVHVVREFNLDERRLWLDFLAPLMADRDFSFEGHDFTPRKTRLKVFDGPQLRADQIGIGRGWQNVERTATDVTAAVLAQAREHTAAAPAPTAADALRERLLGRLSAGPVSLQEIGALAADLMPGSASEEQLAAARQAAWELLASGAAQLAPSDR